MSVVWLGYYPFHFFSKTIQKWLVVLSCDRSARININTIGTNLQNVIFGPNIMSFLIFCLRFRAHGGCANL